MYSIQALPEEEVKEVEVLHSEDFRLKPLHLLLKGLGNESSLFEIFKSIGDILENKINKWYDIKQMADFILVHIKSVYILHYLGNTAVATYWS